MIGLSNRLNAMEESATLAMSRISRELKAQGKDIISLSLGEPDFQTPQFIKDAAVVAMDNNFTTYSPVSGYDDLREAIAAKSIANVVLSLINPGDEVIIPAPYWVSYIEIVKMAEGVPVIIEASIENDFKITPQQFSDAITPKTKLFIFSSPCNPTGTVYSKSELQGLAMVLKPNPSVIALSDEIYEHINFIGSHESLAQFSEIAEQVVTVNGVSKAWAMTGWRLGYIGAPKIIADACNKIQGQFTSGTCSITQKASIAAVNADPILLKEMVQAFHSRRDLVIKKLKEMPGVICNVPEGAFYVFPDVSYFFGSSYNDYKINSAQDLCMYLLAEGQIALVSGEGFGSPSCIRISYAASEEMLTEAMRRMKEALLKLSV
jgi:aspartate aminotransferase